MSNVQSKLLQVANRDVANIVKHWNLGQRGLQCVASGESGQFEGCVSGEEVLLSSKIINDPLHGEVILVDTRDDFFGKFCHYYLKVA